MARKEATVFSVSCDNDGPRGSTVIASTHNTVFTTTVVSGLPTL